MKTKKVFSIVSILIAVLLLALLIGQIRFATRTSTQNTAAVGDTLSQGLVAHWKLDETSGTTAADSSGNSNTGTLQSREGNPPSPRPGKFGGSFWFDGTDDAISAPRVISSIPNSSIALWVYLPSWTEKGSFIKIGDRNGVALGVGSGNFNTPGNQLIANYEGRRWIVPGSTINPGGWTHVTLVVDGSGTPTFYVNGGSPATVAGDGPLAPSGTTQIGGYIYDGANRFYRGQLDDIRVYNRALTAAEVSALAAGITAPPPVVTTTANGAPTALSATALTLSGTPITVTINGSDPENDSLSLTVVSNPLRGNLSNFKKVSATQFQYTYWPVSGYIGTDTFSYKLSDGRSTSNTAVATITINSNGQSISSPPPISTPITVAPPTVVTPPTTVTPPTVVNPPPVIVAPVNSAPLVSSLISYTYQNTPITVLITAADANAGDTLSLSVVSQPTRGTLSNFAKLSNTQFKYTYWPTGDYTGTDTFTYRAYDGKTYSGVGSATITIDRYGQSVYTPPTVVTPVTPVIEPVTPPTTVTPPTVISEVPAAPATDSYPLSVRLFKLNASQREPADRNMSLQTALDTYRAIRLESADYSTISGPITIRSGYKLYGLPGTKTPAITVEGGTRNAVISRVLAGDLTFPQSASVTANNTFSYFMYTNINVRNARLENNLFLDFNYSQLNANTSGSGYLRNNRFVRFRSHGVSPQVTMIGDSGRSSYGNVFLGYNFLTPGGVTTEITNQRDITFVGGDAETWNFNRVTSDALLKIRSSGVVTIYGLQGGGGQSGIYDINADEVRILGSYINTSNGMDLNIGSASKLLLANHDLRNISDTSRIGQSFRAMEDVLGDDPRYNGNTVNGSLSSGGQNALRSMIETVSGAEWERPSYEPIPNPLGSTWNQSLSSKQDRTQEVQNYINSNSIVPPGTYYISSSLRLDSNHMLWGSGEGSTIIVAKSPIDMIVSTDHRDTEANNGIKVKVGDITLQGGRNGINLDAAGAGRYAQLTDAVISHVTMRNMSNAGLNISGIYAIDNVLFDNIKVVDSGAGIKQTPAGCQGGDNPGITYIDKMNVYKGQFVNNDVGFDFPACRANNANVCIDCLFKDNKIAAARMQSNNLPVFANSDFINNAGTPSQPTISNKNSTGNWSSNIVIVGSRFKPGGATALLGAHRIDVEGTTIERGSNASARVVAGSVKASFYNTNSAIDAGTIPSGISLNSLFPSGNMRNVAVYIKNSVQNVLIPGTPNPRPQLLRGERF